MTSSNLSQLASRWTEFVWHTASSGISAVVRRCPGAPIFMLADGKVVRKALAEFSVITFASLLPLLVIVLTNALSDPKSSIGDAFAKYTKAGEILFFVGPIVGASFFLLATEFRRNLNGAPFLSERVWFMVYAFLALVVSVVMLVVHHLSEVQAADVLRYASYVIYGVSLYFSYLQFVYGNFEGAGAVAPTSGAREVSAALAGFDGEHE